MLETLFATLAAKIAAGGIAVAMAATGGLSGTGNLPDPAQTAVSDAVSKIGIHIPSGEEAEEVAVEALDVVEDLAGDVLEEAGDVTEEIDEDTGETGEPNENAAFGQSVAADARDGGVDGQAISEAARAMAAERKAAGQANRPSDAGATTEDEEVVEDGSQAQAGLDIARNTPAGDKVPASVPVGGGRPAGTPGR
jgi:hypothetical protein